MAKDMNKEAFDDATKLKLDIFGDCFEEWLPVFNNNRTDSIFIFDFFAGSGKDSESYPGSPLVLLDKAKGKDCQYCLNTNKKISFFFNESIAEKSKTLEKNIQEYIAECKKKNNCQECAYSYNVTNEEFADFYAQEYVKRILKNKNIGKFILLDQYGFKEINEDVFRELTSYPKTDFIFFISSSFFQQTFKNFSIPKV